MKGVIFCLLAATMVHAMPLSPQELAKEFCQMKRVVAEEQGRSVSSGYFLDPLDRCGHYFWCLYEQHMYYWMPLAPGTMWDESINGQAMILSKALCTQDACTYTDLGLYGVYKRRQEVCGKYQQCENGLSVEKCCPKGHEFNTVNKQCEPVNYECTGTCTEEVPVDEPQDPQEETPDETPDNTPDEPPDETPEENLDDEIFEKGKVYTCEQGGYHFQVLNPKNYIRTAPDGTKVKGGCPESIPYFSYRRCICYSKKSVIKPEAPFELDENQCYNIVDGIVYEKTGVDSYIVVEQEKSGDSKSKKSSEKGGKSKRKSSEGSHDKSEKSDDKEQMICADKNHLFRLDICRCGNKLSEINSCNYFNMDSDNSGLEPMFLKRIGSYEPNKHDICFEGKPDNYISIDLLPFYLGNWFIDHLTVAFKYKFTDTLGPDEYVPLLHTGDDMVAVEDETFSISVKKQYVRVSITTDVYSLCQVEIQVPPLAMPKILPYRMPYVTVVAQYDGSMLTLMVQDRLMKAPCSGNIGPTRPSLNIGANFRGCVDELYICKDVIDPFP